ncbi:hypothetical protein P4B35_08755 [Pontiellaceae bacterium B12227]|nr:hypothetical protein [Pontiellaceae bacterium B12227]
MSWPPVTSESIQTAFSPALVADYQQWLVANSDKYGRLDDIVAMVAGEFRAAIESNPDTVMDETADSLPPACLRHATNIIIFQLKGEMDKTLSEAENAAAIRADVFLRGIWMESIPAASSSRAPSPSYSAPEVAQ